MFGRSRNAVPKELTGSLQKLGYAIVHSRCRLLQATVLEMEKEERWAVLTLILRGGRDLSAARDPQIRYVGDFRGNQMVLSVDI